MSFLWEEAVGPKKIYVVDQVKTLPYYTLRTEPEPHWSEANMQSDHPKIAMVEDIMAICSFKNRTLTILTNKFNLFLFRFNGIRPVV